MSMDVTVIASGSSGNCYRVSDGSSSILLDAGISIKRIREGCGFKLYQIAACFVTHSHGDHCKAVKDIARFGIPVYMTQGEIEAMKPPVSFIRPLLGVPSEYVPVKAGTFIVEPFSVQHDTPEPVGFLVWSKATQERLLYFTDTFYVRQRFFPIDYLIGEVNYDEETLEEHIRSRQTGAYRAKRLFSSHMSLEHFIEFLQANDLSRLKKIWICHMSEDHGNEARIKEAVQRETGAEVEVC